MRAKCEKGVGAMAGIIRFDSPSELEQFKVDSRQSIVTIFQQLERKSVPVFLQTADGHVGESQIVHVDNKNDTLLLAYTPDYALNQKILDDGVYVYAEHFSAQVQFFVPKLAQVMFQQGYVFTITIPDEIYRIQRRESFRAEVPLDNGVRCTIPITGDGHLMVPISDISRGGLALLDRMNRLPVKQGTLLANVQLELPRIGALHADMQVRNRNNYYSPELKHEVARVGCKFISISSGMENILQRYIDQLEFRRRGTM
jgi:c-di-GMP-binding flagellar brake protein YcgR